MIRVEDLSFVYKSEYENEVNELKALDRINLHINKGEFVVIVGRNGSGKSTLGKLFNGLLLPTSGKVYVDGMDTSDEENIWKIRQKAGMIFQNPDNQIVATIVEEDVAFGLENLGVLPSEIGPRVSKALETVDMLKYKDRPPHLLSGGQKQRVAIAGIIAMKPECIILDEPTAMLDPHGRRDVLNTVRRLNKEEGITIVYITHFMEEAVYADRVIVIEDSKMMMDTKPEEIFNDMDKIKRFGLDVPNIVVIADNLRKAGYNIPKDVLTIEKMVEYYVNNC